MTPDLQDLLQEYGVLYITLSQLRKERLGNEFSSLGDYYASLGTALPDEPVLHVRISKDDEIHFLKEGEHDVAVKDEAGNKTGVVTLWELPEDEFWFFRAFRPALFDLEKRLPLFVYEMGVVHAYGMFEAYLTSILRQRFRKHPRLMGSQRQLSYEEIFEAESKPVLIERMIEREIRDIFYLPLLGILEKMRSKLGFRNFTDEYDQRASCIALRRNCLLHNGRLVDEKLAACEPAIKKGDRLLMSDADVSETVNVLRQLAYQIDRNLESTSPSFAEEKSS